MGNPFTVALPPNAELKTISAKKFITIALGKVMIDNFNNFLISINYK